MKHIYPSRTSFVTSLETFQGEHVQDLRLQSGGFETRAGGRRRKSAAVSGTSPGPAGRGSSARSRSCRPPRGCVDSARSPCWSARGQAAWPGGRDRTHAVGDSVEHALGNESAFPRSPPCRNTHSATRGLRCRPVTRARAAPPSAPMGTRPVVPCQTTVQFEVRAITILGSPYMSDYFLLHFGFTATE